MKGVADLRRALLDASLELIAQQGLERLSMREAARRAGVSHQAPYHYFPDREAILAEIVAEGFTKLRDAMLGAIAGVEGAKARLTAIGQAYVAFAIAHPAHFKLMFRSELVRPDRHKSADDCATSAFDVLVSVVREVGGRERKADDALVFASWSMAHGLATLLLEGKLDAHFGKGARARKAAADVVIARFGELIAD